MTEKINSELENFILGCYKSFLLQLSARVGDNITSMEINSMLKHFGIKGEINISMLVKAKVLKRSSDSKEYTPLKLTEKTSSVINALRANITLEDSKVNFRKYLPFRKHAMLIMLNNCIFGKENIRYTEIAEACKVASISMPKMYMFIELGILTKDEGKRTYSWTKKHLPTAASDLLLRVDTTKAGEYKVVVKEEDKTFADTVEESLSPKTALEPKPHIESDEQYNARVAKLEGEPEKEVYLEDKFTQKEEELFPEEEVVEDYKKLEIVKEVPKKKTFWQKLMFWK